MDEQQSFTERWSKFKETLATWRDRLREARVDWQGRLKGAREELWGDIKFQLLENPGACGLLLVPPCIALILLLSNIVHH